MKKFFSAIYYRFAHFKKRTKIFLLLFVIFLTWFSFSLPDPLFNTPTSYVIEDYKGEIEILEINNGFKLGITIPLRKNNDD